MMHWNRQMMSTMSLISIVVDDSLLVEWQIDYVEPVMIIANCSIVQVELMLMLLIDLNIEMDRSMLHLHLRRRRLLLSRPIISYYYCPNAVIQICLIMMKWMRMMKRMDSMISLNWIELIVT